MKDNVKKHHNNNYIFTEEWSSSAIENSNYIFDKFTTPFKVLEIGTFEGYYSLWISDKIGHREHFELHTIDPYDGLNYGIEQSYFDKIEQTWNHNLFLSPYKNKTTFYKQKSFKILNELYLNNKKFDFIYIDGHHRAYHVLEDIIMSYNLLNSGGIMLIDDATLWKYSYDYKLIDISNDIGLTPRMAVDSFIHTNWARIDVLNIPNNIQVAIRKKGLSI